MILGPYTIAIHEAAHAVIASMFGAPWHVVTARERHGRLLPDKEAWQELLAADPDGSWPQQLFAMISLAGPLAEAKWSLNMGTLDRRMGSWFSNLQEGFGGQIDIPTARMWAREGKADYETLADDVIRLFDGDKVWLAVQRVADALIERRTLIDVDVNQLVYGNLRGPRGVEG